MNIDEVKQWLTILGNPTMGLVAFIVIILYRETLGHIISGFFDVIFSYLKRK